MKKQSIGFFICLLCLVVNNLAAQTSIQQPTRVGMLKQQQTITGGFGVTMIDGKPYYLFHLFPELIFGKIGIGLDLNIRVGEDGNIRKEDWDETYDYFRLLRYIRYGSKREPFYARLGALDYARLGHGSIMYFYRNSPSYDSRKIGLELDADFDNVGFESVYSDFGGGGVFGARPYIRPLKFTTAGDIPIVGGLEVGATYAADYHEYAVYTREPNQGPIKDSPLSIFGADIGFPLLSLPELNSTLYADYAKIVDFGSGTAVGIDLNFMGLGMITLGAKYEYRFSGDQFIPAYFDALYEKERYLPFNDPAALTVLVSKSQTLKNTKAAEGYYGELWLSLLGTFNVVGGYYTPVGVKNAGTIHLELETGNALPGIVLIGGYDKKKVGSVFKVDNNSIFYGQVGYKPYPFMIVSMLYEWTFVENKDEQGIVRGYKSQKRVEPKIGFVFTF